MTQELNLTVYHYDLLGELYVCFSLSMFQDRGAWRATVHRVTKSWKQLKQLSMQASDNPYIMSSRILLTEILAPSRFLSPRPSLYCTVSLLRKPSVLPHSLSIPHPPTPAFSRPLGSSVFLPKGPSLFMFSLVSPYILISQHLLGPKLHHLQPKLTAYTPSSPPTPQAHRLHPKLTAYTSSSPIPLHRDPSCVTLGDRWNLCLFLSSSVIWKLTASAS